jgi:polyisoprenoid-binding protein YceI
MLRFSTLGICASTAAFGGPVPPALADVVWSADGAASCVRFSVPHLLLSRVTGTIPIASATIVTADAETVPLLIDAMLDATALTTRDRQRDAQLRSARFFNASAFPKITFASERVVETGVHLFRVEGELTMRGVTRPGVLQMRLVALRRDADGKERVRYAADAVFRRSDYKMTYARGMLGDEVRLAVTLEAVH